MAEEIERETPPMGRHFAWNCKECEYGHFPEDEGLWNCMRCNAPRTALGGEDMEEASSKGETRKKNKRKKKKKKKTGEDMHALAQRTDGRWKKGENALIGAISFLINPPKGSPPDSFKSRASFLAQLLKESGAGEENPAVE
eukprot:gene9743-18737_t